jgi:hypothetical protein
VKKYMIEFSTPANSKKLASDIYANLQECLDQVPPMPNDSIETPVQVTTTSMRTGDETKSGGRSRRHF